MLLRHAISACARRTPTTAAAACVATTRSFATSTSSSNDDASSSSTNLHRKPKPFRDPTPAHMMQIVRQEAMQQARARQNADVDTFDVGDQVAVTQLLELGGHKSEVIKGTVISRQGHDICKYFHILNYQLESQYEMRIPLHSPFIQSIKVIRKARDVKKFPLKRRIKWLKAAPPALYSVS
jgi:large subunit ribosomal protein L19